MESKVEQLGKVCFTVDKEYHNINRDYDKLVIVESYENKATYASRKPVPKGTSLDNREYWIKFSSLAEHIEQNYNVIQQELNELYNKVGVGINFYGDYSTFDFNSSKTINLNFNTVNSFEKASVVKLYQNDTLMDTYTNISEFTKEVTVSSEVTFKVIAKIGNYTFAATWEITTAYNWYVGCGATYQSVMIDSNKHSGTEEPISSVQTITVNHTGDYIFICVQKNMILPEITMGGFSIPFDDPYNAIVDGVEYNIYKSSNSYKVGTYVIKLGAVTWDNDDVLKNLLASITGFSATEQELDERLTIVEEIVGNYNPGGSHGTPEVIPTVDEEDLTIGSGNVFKFKDRPNTDGMGMIILRKDKTFAEQLTQINTIYIIQYDFDLSGESVTIPANCVLEFDGGSLENGTIKTGKVFNVKAGKYDYIFKNVVIDNDGNNIEVYITWFGVLPTNEYNNDNFEKAVYGDHRTIIVPPGTYNFDSKPMECTIRSSIIIGQSYKAANTLDTVQFNINTLEGYANSSAFKLSAYGITIKGIEFNKTGSTSDGIKCIELLDVYNGQVDSHIVECSFDGFLRAVTVHGRGITIDNCLFRTCSQCVEYIPEVQYNEDPAQNPPYDGRAIVLINNRIHVATRFLLINKNEEVPNAAIFGMICSNNLIDSKGDLLLSEIPVNDSIITNNIVLNPLAIGIYLKTGCKGVIIDGNVLSNYMESVPNSSIWIRGNNDHGIQDINICNNVFGKTTSSNITISGELNKINIYNIRINGNNFSGDTVANVKLINIQLCSFLQLSSNNYNVIDSPIPTITFNNVFAVQNSYIEFLKEHDSLIYHDTTDYRKVGLRTSGDVSVMPELPQVCIGQQYFSTALDRPFCWDGAAWVDGQGHSAIRIKGNTFQRPVGKHFVTQDDQTTVVHGLVSSKDVGFEYFDTTLGKPIYAKIINNENGSVTWVDGNGIQADIPASGTFAAKPTVATNFIPEGFRYFCTDKQTTEGATNGIEIIHKGNDVWVDALGRVVS